MSDTGLSTLLIRATAPGTDLTVYDSQLEPVARGRDLLRVPLQPGLYKIHAHGGLGRSASKVVDLPSLPPGDVYEQEIVNPALPTLPIASRLPEGAISHADALDDATRSVRGARRSDAALTVMFRRLAGVDGTPKDEAEQASPRLLDEAGAPVKAFAKGWRNDWERGYAIASIGLRPGTYTLCTTRSSAVSVEQSIVLSSGWRTIVVIPITVSGPLSSLASITMCEVARTWNDIPKARLLISESVFSAMRTGRPPLTREQLADAMDLIRIDPILAIIAASQLLRDNTELKDPTLRDHLVNGLYDCFPNHPDVLGQVWCLREKGGMLRYPPMLAATYIKLVEAGAIRGHDLLRLGSYAEHAGAASLYSGIWLIWPTPASVQNSKDLSSDKTASVSPSIRWVVASVGRLVQEDTARPFTRHAYSVMYQVSKRLLLPKRWQLSLASRLSAWRTAGLHYVGMEKLTSYGGAIAALRRGTAALTLTRLESTAVAESAGIPIRLAATVKQTLATRLGGSMSIPDNTGTEKTSKTSAEEPARTGAFSLPVTWAAIIVLAAFAALVVWMLRSAAVSEQVWQRQMYVYASVEAIVFAAAGALFGVEVKRREVANASQQVDRARDEAEEAKRSERLAAEDAQKGRNIAATARGLAAATAAQLERTGPEADVPGARVGGPSASTSPAAALQALASVADELFPPGR